jgi:outer membrane protein assembly factor BamB
MNTCALLLVMLQLTAPEPDAEWPQWRGLKRDGTVKQLDLPESWPDTLVEKWKLEVGEGHSSPIVAHGKVYLHSRVGDDEVLRCVDLEHGKPVWAKSYPVPYKMHPSAQGHGKGPKSTPAYAYGKLVTLSISGILSCWNTENGEPVWRKEFDQIYAKTSPLYGTSQSPLIHKGYCIVHVGGHDSGALSVFRLKDGHPSWRWVGDGPAYASPIHNRMSSREYVVIQSQRFLRGFDIQTGEPLWKQDFTTPYDQNSVTPLVYRDWIIYSGLGKGIHAFRMSTNEPLEPRVLPVWSNENKHSYMSTPVVWKNLLFGMSGEKKGHIFCMEVKTGKELWEGPGRLGDNATLVSTKRALFVLSTTGKLLVIEPDRKEYRELKSYDVAPTPTWAHPAFVGDRILIKDRDTLRCYAWK